MNKLEKVLTILKIIISLYISYLVLFKGDAGALVNTLGNVIVGGNCVMGLCTIIVIFAIYPVLLYNLLLNQTNLQSKKNKLLVFDIVLVFVNAILGIYIGNHINQMPIEDALSKYAVLTAGSAVIYILLTTTVLLIQKKFVSKESKQTEVELKENKNPFLFIGRIGRLPYFLTKFYLVLLVLLISVICKTCCQATDRFVTVYLLTMFMLSVFVLYFYAASKRLRDIKWSQWLLLIWVIPFVGLFVGIPLLFVKSKY